MEQHHDNLDMAKNVFRRHGGVLRTNEALQAGIHPRTLYELRDRGEIESLSRGLYRLSDLEPLENPDLVTVALKIPQGVLCLISALSYHELTTQIPHQVYLALKRGAERPRLKYPPMRYFWFQKEAFGEGIQEKKVDGASLKIYSPEKTLADCFKYRHKIGMDTALEALKMYREKKKLRLKELMHFAKICRVQKVMEPYLQALL